MTQWEYMFVQIALARGYQTNVYRVFAINNEQVPSWDRGKIWQDFFHEKGAEGWEFMMFDETFLTDAVIGGKLAIFKRAKESPAEVQVRRIGTSPFTTQP